MPTTDIDQPIDLTGRPAATPKPRLGRRITWEALWRERPDLRPDNDNHESAAKSA